MADITEQMATLEISDHSVVAHLKAFVLKNLDTLTLARLESTILPFITMLDTPSPPDFTRKLYREEIMWLILLCLDQACHLDDDEDEFFGLSEETKAVITSHIDCNVCGETLLHLLCRDTGVYGSSPMRPFRWPEHIARFILDAGFSAVEMLDEDGKSIVELASHSPYEIYCTVREYLYQSGYEYICNSLPEE
jgi:hypothetical protein